MATSMEWLITTRAIQGIGGGTLSVTASALIADIIPLRQRGTYQGAIGSVFGVAKVIGPLVGGFLTDNFSWQWVFYVNVPVALAMLPFAFKLLPKTKAEQSPTIDYPGIITISLASAGLVLATSWGGSQYPWSSPVIIGLFAASAVLLVAFVLVERRAREPMLPLHLFRSNVFTVSSVLSFIVGFALMGCMTFLPTFLQYVQGANATDSGIQMLPMVLGLLVASIFAGRTVSARGIYRPFPIAGSIVMAGGLFLLSRLGPGTAYWQTALAMSVMGIGIGLSMQVLVIVVQSTVEYRDLGTATAGVTFLRTMGQAFGSAVFGTIYSTNLTPALAAAVKSSGADPKAVTTPEGVAGLAGAQHTAVVDAYSHTISIMFLSAIPIVLLAFVVALFMKTVTLRDMSRSGATDAGGGFAAPDGRSNAEHLEGYVSRILRTRIPAQIDQVLAGSGLDRAQAWVVRVVAASQERNHGFAQASDIARRRAMPVVVLEPAFAAAEAAGMIETHREGIVLSESGFVALSKLTDNARMVILDEIVKDSETPLTDTEREQFNEVARQILLSDVVGPPRREAVAA